MSSDAKQPGDKVITLKVSRTLICAAAVLLLAGIRTSAHHSFAAEYDEEGIIGEGYAAKDGSNMASARMLKLPDGRRLLGGSKASR